MTSSTTARSARRRALILALALTVGAGGCTSSAPPEDAADSEASSSPDTTQPAEVDTPTESPDPDEHNELPPAPEKPTPPAAMDDLGPDGASAAARYFLEDLYEYSSSSKDFEEWESMTYKTTCDFCTEIPHAFAGPGTEDVEWRGGDITLSNVEVGERDSFYGLYPVFADFEQETQKKFEDGAVRTSAADTVLSGEVVIEVINGGDGWRVMAVSMGQS